MNDQDEQRAAEEIVITLSAEELSELTQFANDLWQRIRDDWMAELSEIMSPSNGVHPSVKRYIADACVLGYRAGALHERDRQAERLRVAESALKEIADKEPHLATRSEAADMAVEFAQVAIAALAKLRENR